MAQVGSAADVARADIVINTTTVGMAGTAGEGGSPVPASLLGGQRLVVDIVYRPLVTPLLEAATNAGVATQGGVGMLIHQAAAQFELFTGHPAPLAAMKASVPELSL